MISYVILHKNRPYLLDINIKLLRKYYPNIQIIIADDGSRPDVVKKISKFQIDDIHVNSRNVNLSTTGSCSNTIQSCIRFCKHDYYMFSEDDYWFAYSPVSLQDDDRDLMFPKFKYLKQADLNILQESIKLLQKNENIKHVQLAINNTQVPVDGNINVKRLTWSYRSKTTQKKSKLVPVTYYYSNCPSMMRLSDIKRVLFPKNTSIWRLENRMNESIDKAFGNYNWAAVPDNRYYLHAGYPFSQRPLSREGSRTSSRRLSVANSIQSKFLKDTPSSSLNDFSNFMVESYLMNKFFIDFDELISSGTEAAFTSAFNRLSKKR